MQDSTAQALVRFSRLITQAVDVGEVLPVLVAAGVEELGAEAAAALSVTDDGRLRVVARRNLPDSLDGWATDAEVVGQELGEQFLAASGPAFGDAEVLPLVSEGDLYGVLVLLAASAKGLDQGRVELAEGLVDLAAVAIARSVQHARLEKAFADLKASREMLARSEKLRALGQMAAGISHDLKNILNPISLQVQLLRRRLLKEQDGADEVLGHIEDAIRTGTDTVERLRSFSRQEADPAAEPRDLNRITDAAIEICMPRVRQHVGAEIRREPADTPPILVRASEMVTALVNLVVNALDASPGKCLITVRTGAADGGAWVEIADDGPGMPPEIEARVFEPFFTTKGAQGTGLGLAMVYAFVQRHGGRITLDTHPGLGAKITLWFPAARQVETIAAAAGQQAVGRRRVLIAEDEPASRAALQTLLAEEGFTVEIAAGGEEALRKLPQFLPDVLLTDLRMPGMDGITLVRHAREWKPSLPIVLMSGLDESQGQAGTMLAGDPTTEKVMKPIDMDQLVAALEKVTRPPAG